MKIKDKVSKFYKEHRTGCNIAIRVITLGVIGYAAYKGMKSVSWKQEEILEIPNESNEIEPEKVTCVPEDSSDKYEWKEDYRKNWDLVHEFAKTLELEDGESYYIEKNTEYSDDLIISHMIDYTGVYPPEDDNCEEDAADQIAS